MQFNRAAAARPRLGRTGSGRRWRDAGPPHDYDHRSRRSSLTSLAGVSVNRRQFSRIALGTFGAAAYAPLEVLGRAASPTPLLRVNRERLMRNLMGLAEYGKNPAGGVSRVAYSEADRGGRELVMGLARAAGLEPRVDVAGNIVARRDGSDRSLPPISIGSHIDSVPDGGNYDGTVGSLGAIEVAHVLREAGTSLRHPLELIIFQNEEGGLVGSRALSGERTDLSLVSRSGKTLRDGIAFIGGDPARIAEARRERGSVAAYVELHIEQGGILERERTPIGIVEGIVGIDWWDVTVTGVSNHAGTTPMDQRRDALLAAARFIDAVNRVVTSVPGRQVGTVGRIEASPGAPNVIPGTVRLSLEIRDLDAAKMRALFERMRAESERIGAETGTTFAFAPTFRSEPAPCDERVRGAIGEAARSLGLATRSMPSGAGHDAQSMARFAPVGMIFIPSVGGVSHSPRELSHPADIENGSNVLLHTVLMLDRGTHG
jgi:N-carbamoyl-L-amino-acid hydrolase